MLDEVVGVTGSLDDTDPEWDAFLGICFFGDVGVATDNFSRGRKNSFNVPVSMAFIKSSCCYI